MKKKKEADMVVLVAALGGVVVVANGCCCRFLFFSSSLLLSVFSAPSLCFSVLLLCSLVVAVLADHNDASGGSRW